MAGFNSSKYDIPLIVPYLYDWFAQKGYSPHIIKKTNKYLCLSCERFRFVDVLNYLGGATSLASFLKSFQIKESKQYFPYDWLDDIKKLDQGHLPEHEHFYSALTNSNISEEQYRHCQNIWETHNMTTFKDYLVFYNTSDVTGFLSAVLKQRQFFKSMHMGFLEKAVSLPALALQLCLQFKEKDSFFTLLGDQRLHDLFRSQLVGGASTVFKKISNH